MKRTSRDMNTANSYSFYPTFQPQAPITNTNTTNFSNSNFGINVPTHEWNPHKTHHTDHQQYFSNHADHNHHKHQERVRHPRTTERDHREHHYKDKERTNNKRTTSHGAHPGDELSDKFAKPNYGNNLNNNNNNYNNNHSNLKSNNFTNLFNNYTTFPPPPTFTQSQKPQHFLAHNYPLDYNKANHSRKSSLFPDISLVPTGHDMEAVGERFSVGTYNILAPSCTFPHFFPSSSIASLKWEHRKYRIISEIEHANLDIVCLQECEYFYEFLEEALAMKHYKGVYWARPERTDGCAIIWKEDKFSLVEANKVDYNTLANRDNDSKLKTNCIGVIAVLENLVTGKNVCVATTHIFWKPQMVDCKIKQVQMLLQEVHSFLQKRPLYHSQSTNETQSTNLQSTNTQTTNLQSTKASESKNSDVVEISEEAPEEIQTDTNSKRKRRKRSATPKMASTTTKIVTVIDVDEETETTTTITAQTRTPTHAHIPTHTPSPSEPHLEMPVIICGDFNISPTSGIYSFITSPDGLLDFSTMSMKQIGARCEEDKYEEGVQLKGTRTHPLKGLQSAYARYQDNHEPIYTTYASRHKGTLDYIFYHPSVLQPVRLLSIPGVEKLERLRGLPNEEWGSDHLLLGCEFAISKKP